MRAAQRRSQAGTGTPPLPGMPAAARSRLKTRCGGLPRVGRAQPLSTDSADDQAGWLRGRLHSRRACRCRPPSVSAQSRKPCAARRASSSALGCGCWATRSSSWQRCRKVWCWAAYWATGGKGGGYQVGPTRASLLQRCMAMVRCRRQTLHAIFSLQRTTLPSFRRAAPAAAECCFRP
jgi:hypothetical protein